MLSSRQGRPSLGCCRRPSGGMDSCWPFARVAMSAPGSEALHRVELLHCTSLPLQCRANESRMPNVGVEMNMLQLVLVPAPERWCMHV